MLDVTDVSFREEVLDNTKLTMVDFWAAWCGPCKALSPSIEKIAEQYDGRLNVVKMDVDTNSIIPNSYKIRGIPALIFFENGEVVKTIVGYVDITVIQEAVEELLNKYEATI